MTILATIARCLAIASALNTVTPTPSWVAMAYTMMESPVTGRCKLSKRSFGNTRRNAKLDDHGFADCREQGAATCDLRLAGRSHEEDVDARGMVNTVSASASESFRRRTLLQSMLGVAGPVLAVPTTSLLPATATAAAAVVKDDKDDDDGSSTAPIVRGEVIEIQDPNGYSAVAYIPPSSHRGFDPPAIETLPLLLVLHGAGRNRHSALYEFTHAPAAAADDTPGDHIHLPPYLLSTRKAPSSLSDHFVVVAPYAGKDRRSLYDDPRADVLSFLSWFCDDWIASHTFVDADMADITDAAGICVSPKKRYLFGFSEGATLAVELATTRRFRGAILASYGFRGPLPKLALERLKGVAVWAFHSKGDDVYDVECSERLVESLLLENGGNNNFFWMEGGDRGGLDAFGMNDIVKFTKLVSLEKEKRKSNAGTVEVKGREHVRAAIVASHSEEVYSWLLSLL